MMINKGISACVLCCAVLFMGCAPLHSALPLTEKAAKPMKTAVYVGRGEAYQFANDNWKRNPTHDYEFMVLQNRHEAGWESVKEIHRRHPDYDGMAGARDQTLYFRVKTSRASDNSIELMLESTWGRGTGQADAELTGIVVEFSPDVSMFAPFNTFRLTQRISYEEGRVVETIELFKKKDGLEFPFMKIVEKAEIFLPMKN